MSNRSDTETLLKFMVEDNYDAWAEILLTVNTNLEEFISELSGFTDYKQIQQIRLGISSGLNVEAIKVYAKPKFNDKQMEQLRLAFKADLSIKQIETFADENIHHDNMSIFVKAYKNHLTNSQIEQLYRHSTDALKDFNFLYNTLLKEKQRSNLRNLLQNFKHLS